VSVSATLIGRFKGRVIRGDVEAAVDQIVGARRQDERGRAHRYRKGCQLDDGDQLDRRARRPGSSVTVKTSWQGAGGIGGFFEKTFVPWACGRFRARCWRTSRSKSRAGMRPDIEDRGFEDLADLSSEEARDTAATASAYF
jgi:hypothetical protein